MKQNNPTNKPAKTKLPKTENRWVDQFFALFNQTMANK